MSAFHAMMQTITSLKNPAVASARALQSARGRSEQGLFWLDGEHMVGEALRFARERVRAVFVQAERAEAYASLLALVPPDADVYGVPEHVLASISQVKTSQGIGAACEPPEALTLDALNGRLILLENVQDPGNVGTILRTADAAGFGGCVLTEGCADPLSPKALRATMGSVFRVPVARVANAADAVMALKARGYTPLGAALDGKPYYERGQLGERVCVLIGNEGAGLTREALDACDLRLRLPMRGGAESLNAAIAAAILMYDIMNR